MGYLMLILGVCCVVLSLAHIPALVTGAGLSHVLAVLFSTFMGGFCIAVFLVRMFPFKG